MTSSHRGISSRIDTAIELYTPEENPFSSVDAANGDAPSGLESSFSAIATALPITTPRLESSITARLSTAPVSGICSDESSPEVQAARAFFAEELPETLTPEYFLQFWQHFQVMQNQVFAGSESTERDHWINILRIVVLDSVRAVPAVISNDVQLAGHAALAQAYQLLLTEYPEQAGDLNAEIRINLANWLPALSEPGISETTRVQQFLAWFQSANASGLLPHFERQLQEFVNTVVSQLEESARGEATPEAALAHRLLALEVLNTVAPTVAGFENLRNDVATEVAAAAHHLETQAEAAEDTQTRLQLLSQAVTIWDALHQNAEDEFAADYRHATEALQNALNNDELPLAFRVQGLYELALQIGQNGDETRSQEILVSLRSEAENLHETAYHSADVEERIALLQDVGTIYAQVGTAEEREAVTSEIRDILEQVEVSVTGTDNPEMLRAAEEFLATNYLQIGDFESAQSHLDSLREHILEDASLSPEAKGFSLVQLGSLYQQLAQTRATAEGGEIDLSSFEQILSDLQSIGEINSLPSMEAYAEWMQAVLAENPEAETLYANLMSSGDATADPYLALAQSIHAQIPGAETDSAIPAWAPTIQFLSLLLEGNYESAIASAEHEGTSSAEILSQRDQMRQMLREIQGFLASGQATSTEEAINLLPTEEFFRLHINEIIYSALGMSAGLLIRAETMEDPATRNETYLLLAREMMARDSSTHRADSAIVSMLSYVEQYEGPGVFDDSRDLWDFLASNSTPAERAASTREWMGYSQAWRQVRNDLFTVEGGLIVMASLLTAGFAGEVAALGTAARFGFATLEEAPLLVRVAAGVNSFAANFAVYEGMHLGLTAAWRRLNGERQMTREEIRTSMISSAITFGTIGVFHASLGRMISAPLMRAGAGEFSLTAARYPITVAAMMTGEEISSATGVTPEDPSPTGVRLFRTVLMTLPFEAGSFAGRVAHEPLSEMTRGALERTAERHRGTYETVVRSARDFADEAMYLAGELYRDERGSMTIGGGGLRRTRPGRSGFSPAVETFGLRTRIGGRGSYAADLNLTEEQSRQLDALLPRDLDYGNRVLYHVSLLSPTEFNTLLEQHRWEMMRNRPTGTRAPTHREALRSFERRLGSMVRELGLGRPTITGVGSTGDGPTEYFATVSWEAAQQFRVSLGLERADFNIVLGGTEVEINGVRTRALPGQRDVPNLLAFDVEPAPSAHAVTPGGQVMVRVGVTTGPTEILMRASEADPVGIHPEMEAVRVRFLAARIRDGRVEIVEDIPADHPERGAVALSVFNISSDEAVLLGLATRRAHGEIRLSPRAVDLFMIRDRNASTPPPMFSGRRPASRSESGLLPEDSTERGAEIRYSVDSREWREMQAEQNRLRRAYQRLLNHADPTDRAPLERYVVAALRAEIILPEVAEAARAAYHLSITDANTGESGRMVFSQSWDSWVILGTARETRGGRSVDVFTLGRTHFPDPMETCTVVSPAGAHPFRVDDRVELRFEGDAPSGGTPEGSDTSSGVEAARSHAIANGGVRSGTTLLLPEANLPETLRLDGLVSEFSAAVGPNGEVWIGRTSAELNWSGGPSPARLQQEVIRLSTAEAVQLGIAEVGENGTVRVTNPSPRLLHIGDELPPTPPSGGGSGGSDGSSAPPSGGTSIGDPTSRISGISATQRSGRFSLDFEPSESDESHRARWVAAREVARSYAAAHGGVRIVPRTSIPANAGYWGPEPAPSGVRILTGTGRWLLQEENLPETLRTSGMVSGYHASVVSGEVWITEAERVSRLWPNEALHLSTAEAVQLGIAEVRADGTVRVTNPTPRLLHVADELSSIETSSETAMECVTGEPIEEVPLASSAVPLREPLAPEIQSHTRSFSELGLGTPRVILEPGNELSEASFAPVVNRDFPAPDKPASGGIFSATAHDRGSAWTDLQWSDGNLIQPESTYYDLSPRPDARIFVLDSRESYRTLLEHYGRPIGGRRLGETGSTRSIDFERLARDFDGLHVTRSALNEIPELYAWDIEQTLWLNWAFDHVEARGRIPQEWAASMWDEESDR